MKDYSEITAAEIAQALYAKDKPTLDKYREAALRVIVDEVEYSTIDGKFSVKRGAPLEFLGVVNHYKKHWSQDSTIRAAIGYVQYVEEAAEAIRQANMLLKIARRS